MKYCFCLLVVSGSPQKIPTFKSYSHSVLCLKVHDDKLFACSSNNEIRSYCLKVKQQDIGI